MKLWTRRTKLCRKSRMSSYSPSYVFDSSVYNFILCNERKEFFSLLREKVWLLTIPKFTGFPLFKRPSQLQVLREGSSCTGQDWAGHTPVAGGPEQRGCQEPALQPGGWRSRRPQEEVSAGAGGEARRCSVCETVSRVHNHSKRQAASGAVVSHPQWWGCGGKGTFVPWWDYTLWKTVWQSLRELKIELLYDPTIPFLGIYLKKMKTLTQKDSCTPMFIAALFKIAKIWMQSKCPSTDDWIKMYSHTQTHVYIYIYIHTYINITQPYKGVKFCHFQWYGWT